MHRGLLVESVVLALDPAEVREGLVGGLDQPPWLKVGVALGHAELSVAQKRSDCLQATPLPHQRAGEGVAQVVDAQVRVQASLRTV